MIINDYNNQCSKVIILIHPMLSSSNAMKVFISNYLGSEYRYIIPDLSNHGAAVDHTYNSAEKEAEEIYNYIKTKNISKIHFAFGASLGGVVLFELIKYSDIEYNNIFFEGVSFNENSFLLNKLEKIIFLYKYKKAVADPELAVKKISSIYGEEAGKHMAENFINMNKESIISIINDCTYVKLPELSESMQEKCIFSFGDKDSDLKKAGKTIPKKYPKSYLKIWKGYNHCEKMTKATEEYITFLKQYI